MMKLISHLGKSLILLSCFLLISSGKTESLSSKMLAKDMSKFLGVKVKPKDVTIFEVWQITYWKNIPKPIFKKIKDHPHKKFIYVEFNYHKKLQHIVSNTNSFFKNKYGADFFIGSNKDSGKKEWYRCNYEMCNPDGSCGKYHLLSQKPCDNNFPPCDESKCTKECWYTTCDGEKCVPIKVVSTDCKPEVGYCQSDGDCSENTQKCAVAICYDGQCVYSYPKQPCEDKLECDGNEDCEEDDDDDPEEEGGLLGKIGEIVLGL